MNYKAFTISPTTSLLMYRDTDDEGIQIVEIKIYWVDEDDDNNMEIIITRFPSEEMCQAFILDFSEESAKIWCNSILSQYEK